MQNEFKLNIENFGPINDAKLDISNLNVVGGVNASGKSFSSRLLFCIVTALSNEGKRIDNQSVKNIFMEFIKKYDLNISITSLNPDEPDKIKLIHELNRLFDSWKEYEVSYDYFNNFYLNFTEILKNYNFNYDNDDLDKIKKVIEAHENKFQYIISLLRFILMSEFGIDQLNDFDDSNVSTSMTESNCKMEYNMHFTSDSLNIGMNNENQITCKEFENVIYIDSMSAMDFQLDGQNIHYHYVSLVDKLVNKKQIDINGVYDNVDELIEFSKKFNNMLNGNFKFNSIDNKFSFELNGKPFDIRNIASGFKQIGVIQKLLINNQISNNTLLILDEPETNLHPSFQVQLADIIVQMVKKLGLTVYINSHSPFIIEALEVYSKKENIEDKTNFYMCESVDDNQNKFNIIPIERDDLKILYDNLSNPFRLINAVRFKNKLNDLD